MLRSHVAAEWDAARRPCLGRDRPVKGQDSKPAQMDSSCSHAMPVGEGSGIRSDSRVTMMVLGLIGSLLIQTCAGRELLAFALTVCLSCSLAAMPSGCSKALGEAAVLHAELILLTTLCAGDYVVLRAEMDLVAVMSACPASDISPLNGPTGKSHDVHCQVFKGT